MVPGNEFAPDVRLHRCFLEDQQVRLRADLIKILHPFRVPAFLDVPVDDADIAGIQRPRRRPSIAVETGNTGRRIGSGHGRHTHRGRRLRGAAREHQQCAVLGQVTDNRRHQGPHVPGIGGFYREILGNCG